ncbi:myb family transcription factor EFM-like [Cucurbita moschata]|uniref:Myb family transcription factor EFM-like n=1 Tax=Cucurbita moschata TaxID=3662 RepID=A0A6J1ECS7_CUCMO|nr:myb family transcription factor EFM-like [Cucurbita moschata]XP_022925867.1 myb family transcription factor EFM-like [Cucurbita moschata]
MASTQLSLECQVQSYSMLLQYSFGDQHQVAPNSHDFYYKLQEFVSRLEQERLKIDVFKRELPLCMQLLTNAVETSRRQLQACKAMEAPPSKPVLEEFMPLKNSTTVDDEKPPAILSDKANWMTSLQLWSQANKEYTDPPHSHNNNDNSDTPKQRVSNGAFVPFDKDRNLEPGLGVGGSGVNGVAAEMELLEKGEKEEKKNHCGDTNNSVDGGIVTATEDRTERGAGEVGLAPTMSSTTTQTHRKARRCWSPDLHRRFVNALQMLGGSQVATPKQIRELMKVDGLTNDEVKSHLQKYRLHTVRRPGLAPQASGSPAAQLVVLGLGGLWVPPEYARSPTLYGPPATSHPPSHLYTPASVPQEYYTRTIAPPHLQQHHHQVHLYKGEPTKAAQISPASEVRDTAERSESLEEEKSEGGQNGENRRIIGRGSWGRRLEGEESNRSEVSLKF